MLQKKKNGFTLVEVIVVLVILAILAAVLVPVLTGFINKAKEENAIAECQSCVKASQALASESYALDENVTIDLTKAQTLAEVDGIGIIANVETVKGGVNHLNYNNDKYRVEYCKAGGCAECGNQETYTVTESNGKNKQQMADETFANLIKKLKNPTIAYGNKVDGVNSQKEGTAAYEVYHALNKEEQAFLDSVSWSYVKVTAGWRLYFTESNYGTGNEENVKVYKYDPATGKYQYTSKGTKIENGEVRPSGDPWSDWSATMD